MSAEMYDSIGTALDERIENLTEQEANRLNAIENVDERLAAAGFKAATVAEFLGLSPEEEGLIEVRLSLARALRARRQSAHMTQTDLAKKSVPVSRGLPKWKRQTLRFRLICWCGRILQRAQHDTICGVLCLPLVLQKGLRASALHKKFLFLNREGLPDA